MQVFLSIEDIYNCTYQMSVKSSQIYSKLYGGVEVIGI